MIAWPIIDQLRVAGERALEKRCEQGSSGFKIEGIKARHSICVGKSQGPPGCRSAIWHGVKVVHERLWLGVEHQKQLRKMPKRA
jgi:hypothetical protein